MFDCYFVKMQLLVFMESKKKEKVYQKSNEIDNKIAETKLNQRKYKQQTQNITLTPVT